MSKAQLRSEFRRLSAGPLASVASDAHERLTARVLDWCLQRPEMRTITLFGGLPGEPDLASSLGEPLRAAGRRVALFAIQPGLDHAMEAWLVASLPAMRRGLHGVWEPDTRLGRRLDPDEIDVVLAPGLFFCPQSGARLGRGGGFFDRYLERAKRALKVGVGLDWQLRAGLPAEAHDHPLDGLLTESRWIDLRGVVKPAEAVSSQTVE